ncbi:MAG: hypothetical protein RLZZ393_1727 [Pseudomonadota bacterium]|jgi:hypothetical protein
MDSRYDCQLHLAFPVEVEEELIDILRAESALVSGFSILPAEGFGAGARLASTMEQVRGRARRRLALVLMRQEQVPALLDALRARLRSPEMAWWTVPVSGFGRFA